MIYIENIIRCGIVNTPTRCSGLEVVYAEHKDNSRLKEAKLTFIGESAMVRIFTDYINDCIQGILLSLLVLKL